MQRRVGPDRTIRAVIAHAQSALSAAGHLSVEGHASDGLPDQIDDARRECPELKNRQSKGRFSQRC
jgi:hypothetical protein